MRICFVCCLQWFDDVWRVDGNHHRQVVGSLDPPPRWSLVSSECEELGGLLRLHPRWVFVAEKRWQYVSRTTGTASLSPSLALNSCNMASLLGSISSTGSPCITSGVSWGGLRDAVPPKASRISLLLRSICGFGFFFGHEGGPKSQFESFIGLTKGLWTLAFGRLGRGLVADSGISTSRVPNTGEDDACGVGSP